MSSGTLAPAVLLALILSAAAAPAAAAEYRDGVYQVRNGVILEAGGQAGGTGLNRLFGTLELDFEPVNETDWTAHIVAADLRMLPISNPWYAGTGGSQEPDGWPLSEEYLISLVDDLRTPGIELGVFVGGELHGFELQQVGRSTFFLRGLFNPYPCCDSHYWVVEGALLELLGDAPADALVLQPDAAAEHDLQVEVEWTSPETAGRGVPAKQGAQFGYFWFFRPDNPELLVKVLDGCAVNGHFWFFVAGLTNLGVDVAITDRETEMTKRYANPVGRQFDPILDTTAVPCGEPVS